MNVRSLVIVGLAAVVSLGCDKLPLDKIPFVNKFVQQAADSTADSTTGAGATTDSTTVADSTADSTTVADSTGAPPAVPDSTEPAPGAQPPAPTPQPQPETDPQPQPRPEPQPQRPARPPPQVIGGQSGEEPWFPTDTGTVRPGMTADEVIGQWGTPAAERALGRFTFLYFRNGCERSCGTFDLVMLEGGQVVDAIVRGRGHSYAGLSSSPANRVAEFTPPIQPADTSRVIG